MHSTVMSLALEDQMSDQMVFAIFDAQKCSERKFMLMVMIAES